MPFTVTTWNVENFVSTSVVFAEKVNFLASTLKALTPDVVALQEVLDIAALDALADKLGYDRADAPPDGRGNRVALLARKGLLTAMRPIRDWALPDNTLVQELDQNGAVVALPRFSRPALEVEIKHDGLKITILVAHLKSKLLTFPGGGFSTTDETVRASAAYFALARRAAEAKSLRERATALLKEGSHVVVAGDLNDGDDAATTQILYGPAGGQPRGPADAQNANGAFQRADAMDAQRLFNVAKLVDAPLRWSRIHEGQPELLDHILASEGLLPRTGKLRRVPAVTILNADAPTAPPKPEINKVQPDHAPVTAVFDV